MYFINNLLATMIKKNYILGILNQKRRRRRRRWKKGECRSEGVKYRGSNEGHDCSPLAGKHPTPSVEVTASITTVRSW